MKAIVQRVSSTSVRINGSIHANIDHGICVLVGYCKGDNELVNIWFVEKLLGLRIFEDDLNKMNLSLQDIQGSILIIPNFTLCADTQKGHRPSFLGAESPEKAEQLYHHLLSTLTNKYTNVQSGIFGADMNVEIQNNGPVTLIFEH
ncbi:D-aminoacyl-tRNA deacylase [Chlorobiota bacterium]|nr:D-aminoacyl-tRNA deacylase [Chlorobiota bacterium]